MINDLSEADTDSESSISLNTNDSSDKSIKDGNSSEGSDSPFGNENATNNLGMES